MLNIFTFLYLFLLSLLPFNSWSHGLEGQPESFIPTESSTDAEKTVTNLIYRKLVNYNAFTGETTLDLVDSYKVYEDGIAYEIKLKENQYWHDGVEITADDLLYTASISSNLREVSSDKIDKYTVRFILPNKYTPFLSVLDLYLLPAHLEGKNNKLTPIGSGNYKVIRIKRDRARIEEVILMKKNLDGPINKLTFRFYDTEEDLLLALRLHEVNSILSNRDEKIEGYKKKKEIFYGRNYLIVFNSKKEYLNKETRRNFIKSINLDDLISNQEYEHGIRPHGPFSNIWADSDSYEQISYDPDLSFEIDKELTFVIPRIREAKLIAENIAKQLKDKDIADIKIVEIERENYVKEIRNTDYDLVLLAHEYGKDPDRYVFWHSSQNESGLNFSNFSAIRTDKSLEEGREATTNEERKEHYNIFQSVFSEEAVAFYLVHPTQFFYYSSNLKGVPDTKIYYPWDIFNSLNKWKFNKAKTLF